MQNGGVVAGFTSHDGHAESVGDEFGAHVTVNRPADDQAGVGVHDRGIVDLPFLGRSVMSVIHNRSGPSTVKWRLTRSGAGSAAGSRTVVQDRLRRVEALDTGLAHEPGDAFPFTGKPRPRVSSACTRGDP